MEERAGNIFVDDSRRINRTRRDQARCDQAERIDPSNQSARKKRASETGSDKQKYP